MGPAEMRTIAGWIGEVLATPDSADVITSVRTRVKELTSAFPIY
jgi:glycine hydroxymethyltransferase